jgi:hypothetical protein
MAVRRIYNALQALASDPTMLRADQATSVEAARVARAGNDIGANEGAILTTGVVQAVRDRGGAMVKVRGGSVQAGQATDEPLRAGQQVWVSKTKDGRWIIHGSVK